VKPIQDLGLVVETDCDALVVGSLLEGRNITREKMKKFLFFPGCPGLGYQSPFTMYDKPYQLLRRRVTAIKYTEDYSDRKQVVGGTYVLGCFGGQRLLLKLSLSGKVLHDRGLRGQDILDLFGDRGFLQKDTLGKSEYAYRIFRIMAMLDVDFVGRRNLPLTKKMAGYVLDSHWVPTFLEAMRQYVAEEITALDPGVFTRVETRLEIR
jgi:hypothetical protein